MHKFDQLIMDSMVNTEAMLKARRKVLQQKRDAGLDVTHEIMRAGRFLQRHQAFLRDWQYWYYDDLAGQGDASGRHDKLSSG